MAFPTALSPWPTRRQSLYTTRWGSGRPARPPSRKELGTLWKFAPSLQVFRSSPPPACNAPALPSPGVCGCRAGPPQLAGVNRPEPSRLRGARAARRPPRGSPLTLSRGGAAAPVAVAKAGPTAARPHRLLAAARGAVAPGWAVAVAGTRRRGEPRTGARLRRGCSRGSGLPARLPSPGPAWVPWAASGARCAAARARGEAGSVCRAAGIGGSVCARARVCLCSCVFFLLPGGCEGLRSSPFS